ncbi:RNA-binding protein [Lactococcus allomyrinae]|uniref:RNA-binding protein n=1 Tax=Lactococcus allomyrinae TaxID=2419773 RepID=A0A387BK93_9LACT|nr:RNA-binding protein [Lactococcus allomyrinae]AYG01400.1 RNA-binding protein [Lactococcus allomyrinae]
MIGQIKNITKFGLFVSFFITGKETDESFIPKGVGLLRWSELPKRVPKLEVGDLIGVSILKRYEDEKVDLSYVEKDFKSTYGTFLEVSARKIEELKIMNKSDLSL